MKLVIAPDSFKGTLTAQEAASALGQGVARMCPDADLDLCPMADGGEGTVLAMVAAIGGKLRTETVSGPLGEDIEAVFGLIHRPGTDDLTAVVEMAAASGLPLVPREHRDPGRTTTFGTGELIRAALDAGAREIILGIGGSATVDGGTGCLQALGIRFLDASGAILAERLCGGELRSIAAIDAGGLDPRFGETSVRVACDVTSPLLGLSGAAEVYGPQKGATPAAVRELEAGLEHLASLSGSRELADHPGAGAAGGLGFGLAAFLGATLEPGLPLVAEAVGLRERLLGADLCITGEGRLDAQSSAGKTAVGVARIAADLGVPVICIPGQADAAAPFELFDRVHPIVGSGVGLDDALAHPRPWLARRAAEAVARFVNP